MNIRTFILSVLFVAASGQVSIAQDTSDANPLDQFSRLIGGEWHMQGSYSVFEWGVGKKSIKSQSYFVINEEPMLVSEGSWFWHPGDKKIKGYFTAVQMPVELFDYTITFEENTLIGDLRSYSSSGALSEYVETWEFTDDDHYTWTLFSSSSGEKKKVMGAIYKRKNQK